MAIPPFGTNIPRERRAVNTGKNGLRSGALSATIEKIDSFVEMETDRQKCNLAIDLPGIHVEKTFSDTEISPLGKTALSNLKSVFEEYNDAIEPEEQLAIIARLIGDIIQ